MSKEVTFELNKHNKPKILNSQDSIVQTVMMALFMKPGNLPSLPNVGVDLDKYLYKSSDEFNEDKLVADLEFSCGQLLSGGVFITNIRFKIVNTANGPVFILAMDVSGQDDSTLLLGIRKESDAVSFNYEFTNLNM